MNLKEAMQALVEGKKIRIKNLNWSPEYFLSLKNNGDFTIYEGGACSRLVFTNYSYLANNHEYELWKDPNETIYGLIRKGDRFWNRDKEEFIKTGDIAVMITGSLKGCKFGFCPNDVFYTKCPI